MQQPGKPTADERAQDSMTMSHNRPLPLPVTTRLARKPATRPTRMKIRMLPISPTGLFNPTFPDSLLTHNEKAMPTEQYHEPPGGLTKQGRTFARMIASLQEEAEAIGWYEQRIALESDLQAKAIMNDAQQEEFKHFAMALEFLSRRKPRWRVVLKDVLFQEGDIVEHGEEAEEEEKKV